MNNYSRLSLKKVKTMDENHETASDGAYCGSPRSQQELEEEGHSKRQAVNKKFYNLYSTRNSFGIGKRHTSMTPRTKSVSG